MTKLRFASPLLVGLLVAPEAHAHGGAASIGDQRDFVLVGADLAYFHADDEGTLRYGVEASWVRWHDMLWWGALTGVRFDTAFEQSTVALGIEGGAAIFAADLSLVADLGERNGIGVRGRGCVAVFVVSLCAGGTASTVGASLELGGTLKFPIQLSGTPL